PLHAAHLSFASATIAALTASRGLVIGGTCKTAKNRRLPSARSEDHAEALVAVGWPARSKTWTTPSHTVLPSCVSCTGTAWTRVAVPSCWDSTACFNSLGFTSVM